MKTKLLIGIDPGVKTGLAIWNATKQELVCVKTMLIHEAMAVVDSFINQKIHTSKVIEPVNRYNIKVFVEDARLRKWYGSNSNVKQQGAGSIKRDCKIWEDFLKGIKGIEYEMIHPIKGGTKIDSKLFKQMTGWEGRTSEHGRDAAMIVFKKT